MYLKVLKYHRLKADISYDDFYVTTASKEWEEDISSYFDDKPVRFIIISGNVGSGKTTYLNRLLKRLEESEHIIALMAHNNPAKITESMITGKLLRVMGKSGGQERMDGERKQEIISEKLGFQENRLILAIDDAHKLKAETLEILKKISEKGISIILAGRTQFAEELSLSYYKETGMHLEIFEVPSITGEVQGYLEFLLDKSGATIELFSDDAVNELDHICQTPLQVRKIAWESLKIAVINDESQVSSDIIYTVHQCLSDGRLPDPRSCLSDLTDEDIKFVGEIA